MKGPAPIRPADGEGVLAALPPISSETSASAIVVLSLGSNFWKVRRPVESVGP